MTKTKPLTQGRHRKKALINPLGVIHIYLKTQIKNSRKKQLQKRARTPVLPVLKQQCYPLHYGASSRALGIHTDTESARATKLLT